jgi:hypothetical protein
MHNDPKSKLRQTSSDLIVMAWRKQEKSLYGLLISVMVEEFGGDSILGHWRENPWTTK